MRKAEDVT